MAEDYSPEEFREDWLDEHGFDSDDDRLNELFEELDLYTIMQESASQDDFHERLHDMYDPESDEYDYQWAQAMDEFLNLLDYESIDDLEGWYHG